MFENWMVSMWSIVYKEAADFFSSISLKKKDHFLKVFQTEQCFLFGFLKKLVNWENCLLFLSIALFFFTNQNKKWPKRFFSYQPPLFSTCSTFPSHSTILKFLEKISMHLINLKSAMSNSSPTFIPKLRLMCSTYKVKRLLQN